MKKSFLLLKLSFLFTNASYAMDESEAWKDKHGIKDNPVAVVADNNNHNSQVMKLDQFDMFTIDKINQFLDVETFTKFAALNKKIHRYSLPRKLTIKCHKLPTYMENWVEQYSSKISDPRYRHIEKIELNRIDSCLPLISLKHENYLPITTNIDTRLESDYPYSNYIILIKKNSY